MSARKKPWRPSYRVVPHTDPFGRKWWAVVGEQLVHHLEGSECKYVARGEAVRVRDGLRHLQAEAEARA